MARETLTDKTVQQRRTLKNQVNSHKSTLDGLQAGTLGKLYVFTGKNGAGACTLTGAAVGDKVCGMVINATDLADATANYETTITVADQIQQSAATDQSTKKHLVILVKQTS